MYHQLNVTEYKEFLIAFVLQALIKNVFPKPEKKSFDHCILSGFSIYELKYHIYTTSLESVNCISNDHTEQCDF